MPNSKNNTKWKKQEEGWGKRQEFYKVLKARASGEGRQVVLGVAVDNGWEAWRRLALQLEPSSAVEANSCPNWDCLS